MATTVSMPQLGETVTEGTILRWLKQVGDTIAEDELLVEISTDKVDTEVPSPASGVIAEILAGEGDTIAVGTPMVVIAEAGEAASPASDPEEGPAQSPEPESAPEPVPELQPEAASGPVAGEPAAADAGSGPGDFLSPVVRKLAREHNIDASLIIGSGRDGRVTRNDLLAYIDRQVGPAAQPEAAPVPEPVSASVSAPESVPAPEPAPVPESAPAPESAPVLESVPVPEPAPAAPQTKPAPAPSPPPTPAPSPVPARAPAPAVPATVPGAAAVAAARRGDEIRDLDRLRARIGANMIKAKQTAAHVWTSFEVDFERVERVRQAHKVQFKADEGFSLTYLPFIARATMDALREYPVVNSSFYLEELKAVFHHDINLGIAVDLNQEGLVVTTVKNANDLTMRGLARSIRQVAERARDGKLDPDDISGSTFTITNPGPSGSFMSAPIINVPNVAILSTDTVTKRPTVVTTADGQDTLAIRHIGYLGLSWDHRAFDGSTAVMFLRRIKDNLENWDWEQQLT